MKIKYYKNIHNKEVVYEDEAELYVMEKLGINITAKGENGNLTEEQQEFIDTFTEWYFSDNWIEEWEDVGWWKNVKKSMTYQTKNY